MTALRADIAANRVATRNLFQDIIRELVTDRKSFGQVTGNELEDRVVPAFRRTIAERVAVADQLRLQHRLGHVFAGDKALRSVFEPAEAQALDAFFSASETQGLIPGNSAIHKKSPIREMLRDLLLHGSIWPVTNVWTHVTSVADETQKNKALAIEQLTSAYENYDAVAAGREEEINEGPVGWHKQILLASLAAVRYPRVMQAMLKLGKPEKGDFVEFDQMASVERHDKEQRAQAAYGGLGISKPQLEGLKAELQDALEDSKKTSVAGDDVRAVWEAFRAFVSHEAQGWDIVAQTKIGVKPKAAANDDGYVGALRYRASENTRKKPQTIFNRISKMLEVD